MRMNTKHVVSARLRWYVFWLYGCAQSTLQHFERWEAGGMTVLMHLPLLHPICSAFVQYMESK